MNSTETIEIIQQVAKSSPDPMYVGLGWVLGIIILVIAISKPIMGMVRQYQTAKADGAKDSADQTLYVQLKEQIEINSRDIRSLIDERNKWQEEALQLRFRVSQLEAAEKAVERMKDKLDQKDELLRQRDEENRRLMLEIIKLKDRLHALELMVAGNPLKFGSESVAEVEG